MSCKGARARRAGGAPVRDGRRQRPAHADGRLDHGGRWITAADWPPPGPRSTPYHLHADGRLDPAAPDAADAAPLSYDFDPAHPVPTIGGNLSSLDPVAVAGAFDQVERPEFFGCAPPYLPLASRADVLVFQTAPLARTVQIAGPIEAELWVATDGPDTDFTAKLIDVHPPRADYPARLRDAALGRHPAAALCRGSGGTAPARAGRGGAHPHHAVPDCQSVPARASHPARHLVEQLSEIRRQPEHGRAGGHGATAADRASTRCSPRPAGRAASCCRSWICNGGKE